MQTRKYFDIFIYKSCKCLFVPFRSSRYRQTLFLERAILLFVKTLFSNIPGHNESKTNLIRLQIVLNALYIFKREAAHFFFWIYAKIRSYWENCKKVLLGCSNHICSSIVTVDYVAFIFSRRFPIRSSTCPIKSIRSFSRHRLSSFSSKLILTSIISRNNSRNNSDEQAPNCQLYGKCLYHEIRSENYDGYTELIKLAPHNSLRHVYFAFIAQFNPYSRSGYMWFTTPTWCIANGRLKM